MVNSKLGGAANTWDEIPGDTWCVRVPHGAVLNTGITVYPTTPPGTVQVAGPPSQDVSVHYMDVKGARQEPGHVVPLSHLQHQHGVAVALLRGPSPPAAGEVPTRIVFVEGPITKDTAKG